MLKIEPVAPRHRRRALELLAGRNRRAESFEAMLAGPEGDGCRLWWARGALGPRAAAMTVPGPGRMAMVYHSPARPRAGPEDIRTLSRLLAEVSAAALGERAVLVQALLRPEAAGDIEALAAAGFRHLAELIYLEHRLLRPPAEAPAPAGLAWETFRPALAGRLAHVIADTYLGSLDCPGLRGLRRMEDVIAAHKASGRFRPEGWWMPTLAGECVGCVLVNDAAGREDAAEVVYLGVRPAFRRRGLGRAMLRRALADAAARRLHKVNLAVDAGNLPAVRLYQEEGFGETKRRQTFIRTRKT